jgi:hypothetical protein
MVSGHQTRSVFERYHIVSDEDLKSAAARREEYHRSQIGHNFGAQSRIRAIKKGLTGSANPLIFLVPEERIELSWAQGPLDFESLTPSFPTSSQDCKSLELLNFMFAYLCRSLLISAGSGELFSHGFSHSRTQLDWLSEPIQRHFILLLPPHRRYCP